MDELVGRVEAWVRERREQLIGELARWVAQPSVSVTGEGMPGAQRHAAFSDELGVPCYGIPLANADESNHAPNENLELNWFLRGIVAAAAVQHAIAAHEAHHSPAGGGCD